MRFFAYLQSLSFPRVLLKQFLAESRRHALLHVVSLSSLLLAAAIVRTTELDFRFAIVARFIVVFCILAASVLLLPLLVMKGLRCARGDDDAPFVPEFLRRHVLAPERVARLLHVMIAIAVLQIAYNVIKRAIPVFHPFAFDRQLAELDRWLHFGVDPYRLLMPVFGTPLATYFLAYAYHFWFFLMPVFWAWQALSGKDRGMRFLLAFMLLWIVGSGGLGTLLSSVGPCYYANLFPGDALFEPLMAKLREASAVYPIAALSVQDMLWKGHVTGTGIVHGISAMPSMHVGTSVLFALAAPRRTVLRKLLAVFAVVIFLGSIQLGWHYAVDGYVAVLLAVLFWWMAAGLVRWDRRQWRSVPTTRLKVALSTPVVAHVDA